MAVYFFPISAACDALLWGFAKVFFSEWWFQFSHRPNLKWKMSVSSRFHITFPGKRRFLQFRVGLKQSQLSLHQTPLQPLPSVCEDSAARQKQQIVRSSSWNDWLTTMNHRLLKNHQSIVNQPPFSLPTCFGRRLRWTVWASVCVYLLFWKHRIGRYKGETRDRDKGNRCVISKIMKIRRWCAFLGLFQLFVLS